VYRWRTLRTAIRNANCTTQWIIEPLNAYCAVAVNDTACLVECRFQISHVIHIRCRRTITYDDITVCVPCWFCETRWESAFFLVKERGAVSLKPTLLGWTSVAIVCISHDVYIVTIFWKWCVVHTVCPSFVVRLPLKSTDWIEDLPCGNYLMLDKDSFFYQVWGGHLLMPSERKTVLGPPFSVHPLFCEMADCSCVSCVCVYVHSMYFRTNPKFVCV